MEQKWRSCTAFLLLVLFSSPTIIGKVKPRKLLVVISLPMTAPELCPARRAHDGEALKETTAATAMWMFNN